MKEIVIDLDDKEAAIAFLKGLCGSDGCFVEAGGAGDVVDFWDVVDVKGAKDGLCEEREERFRVQTERASTD